MKKNQSYRIAFIKPNKTVFLLFIVGNFYFFSSVLAIDEAFLRNHLETILSYGPRPSGSIGLRKTQEYISYFFKQQQISLTKYDFIVETPIGKIPMRNLFALIPGKVPQTIIFACHYESKYFKEFVFLGANDSAASIALLLELARVIKKQQSYYSVGFLFLDGEEAFLSWNDKDSLYGSRYQANFWQKNSFLKQIKALIVLDMVGDSSSRFCREGNSDYELSLQIFHLATKKGLKQFDSSCSSFIEDDHIPFLQKGVKAITLIPYPFPSYWHTPDDTLDKISFSFLSQIGLLMLSFLTTFS